MKVRSALLALALLLVAVSPTPAAVTTSHVTCAATATLVYTAPLAGVGRVLVRNTSADTSIFLGASDVTTATGFDLAFGAAVGINLGYGDTLYCRVASGTQPLVTLSGANPQ